MTSNDSNDVPRTERPAVPQFGQYATPEEQKARIQDLSANPYYAATLENASEPAKTDAKDGRLHKSAEVKKMASTATSPRTGITRSTAAAGFAASPNATVDRFLTYALLGYGLFNVLVSFPTFLDMGTLMVNAISSLGTQFDVELSAYTVTDLTAQVGIALAFSWVALWLASLWWSLKRLQATKPAFWIPLGAGIIANVLVTIGTVVLLVADPVFVELMNSVS